MLFVSILLAVTGLVFVWRDISGFVEGRAVHKSIRDVVKAGKIFPTSVRPVSGASQDVLIPDAGVYEEMPPFFGEFANPVIGEFLEWLTITKHPIRQDDAGASDVCFSGSVQRIVGEYFVVMLTKFRQEDFGWPSPQN